MRVRLLRSTRSLGTVTLALTAACLTATLLVADPASGDSAGDVVVVSADDGTPISGGGGDTEFSLQLPADAACPGDSQDAQYRVQSFLVPKSVDPGTLVYEGLRPKTEGGWALYRVDTSTFVNHFTAQATEPGGEGAIIDIPSVSFAVFDPGMIPVGPAHIGIACSLFGKTERYWATEIEVVADVDDAAGIAWTVTDPPADTKGDGGSSSTVAIGVAAAAAGAAAVLVRRRSRTSVRGTPART